MRKTRKTSFIIAYNVICQKGIVELQEGFASASTLWLLNGRFKGNQLSLSSLFVCMRKGGGGGCLLLRAPLRLGSLFGFLPRHTNPFIHPSGVAELATDLSGKNKALNCSLAGRAPQFIVYSKKAFKLPPRHLAEVALIAQLVKNKDFLEASSNQSGRLNVWRLSRNITTRLIPFT